MDFSTILGILSGMGMIVMAIISKNSIMVFYDTSSLLIVCGGTFASALMSFSFKSMMWTFRDIFKTFMSHKIDLHGTINMLIKYSELIKTEGHLALGKVKSDDHLTQKGLHLIADGVNLANFKEMLIIERESLIARERESWMVLEKMSDLAPSWGLIGTLIGLVLMMLEISNPENLGSGMSVALLTTFYGAVLSNLVFGPLATKLEQRSKRNFIQSELIVEGLTSILQRENPRLIREKLVGFLDPHDDHHSTTGDANR
ncbi:MotA/TolQ/ExbB proton channel family protein [candidate division KSB1 bacterium]|nr:MotA/TolQ/ExbB proton channel family protein [candidate division KSB1 bacterium]